MNQTQAINQLFFVIFGLILTSLFVSTYRVGINASHSDETRRYWLLSLGGRSGAFFAWSVVPLLGPALTLVANSLFIFSAGCLALLFRSWRSQAPIRMLYGVIAFSLTVATVMEIIRQSGLGFELRMILIGSASLAISTWELSELRPKIRTESDPSLKLIAGVVVVQMTLSGASVISSVLNADRKINVITDNGTTSMVVIWMTLAVHLVIYLFIGGYLYRRALLGELAAVQQKDEVTALLQERERLLASLIASNRVASTGALSASVAHEMSQPLTAAILKLALLKRTLSKAPDENVESATLLAEALDNISRSKDVLDHLRSLFRQDPVKLKRCNIHDLLTQTIALVRSRLESARIDLQYFPVPSVDAEIVDREIQQVLINLINNAIDSLSNVDDARKLISIEVAALNDSARIIVSDNGPGIQPDLADSLFELARSSKLDGMGVGLWISRYIIEDHHRGRLYIEQTNLPGARFVIELPRT